MENHGSQEQLLTNCAGMGSIGVGGVSRVSAESWCEDPTRPGPCRISHFFAYPWFAWDEALSEISKLSDEIILSPQVTSSLLKYMGDIPGSEDSLVFPLKSSQVGLLNSPVQ
ncbi:hypothetical protein Bca4012_098837 [Brassica carinata]